MFTGGEQWLRWSANNVVDRPLAVGVNNRSIVSLRLQFKTHHQAASQECEESGL